MPFSRPYAQRTTNTLNPQPWPRQGTPTIRAHWLHTRVVLHDGGRPQFIQADEGGQPGEAHLARWFVGHHTAKCCVHQALQLMNALLDHRLKTDTSKMWTAVGWETWNEVWLAEKLEIWLAEKLQIKSSPFFFPLHSHDFRALTLSKLFQVPSCHVISHFISRYWLLVFSNYNLRSTITLSSFVQSWHHCWWGGETVMAFCFWHQLMLLTCAVALIIIHAVWKLRRFLEFDFSWCRSPVLSQCCSPVLYSSHINRHHCSWDEETTKVF